MKSIIKKIKETNKSFETDSQRETISEINNPATKDNRRSFLKKTLLGGMALSTIPGISYEKTIEQVTSKVQRSSSPTDLKITDLRYAIVSNGTGSTNARNVIVRIDTNQGIYGLGEVRDGADARYALFLKSRILGRNPCNVEMLFKSIKQFGGHGRQAGGVVGVEMALWDLAGKAFNVPVWMMLGGRYRDKVRMYAYVPNSGEGALAKIDLNKFKEDVRHRIVDQGFTWLKMHPGIGVVSGIPGATVGTKFRYVASLNELDNNWLMQNTKHAFTPVQYTEKGLEALGEYVGTIRDIVGWDIPLSADHQGRFDLNTCIRVGNALEKYSLASLEDFLNWTSMDEIKMVTDAIQTPTLTGEDIYLKEEFIKLCDNHIVDMVHPDMGTSGGILETKKIGDYAEEKDISMLQHFAGTPVSFMANVHCAAATQNSLALEVPNQIADNPWWPTLVKMVGLKSIYENGYANVPDDVPGLGIELNDEIMKQHLHKEDPTYFEPTPLWNEARSSDRQWS